jgi:hypothetical protein
MSLTDIVEEAKELANKVIKTNPEVLSPDLNFPKTSGIYLIYEDNRVIYVGQSKNLRRRLKQHLSSSDSMKKSAFRRALRDNRDLQPQDTRKWMLDRCSVATEAIKDSDMCNIVEAILIAYYRGENEELLNS